MPRSGWEGRFGVKWDDLRVFLACVDHGSLRATARAIKMNSAAVAGKLARLETALGVRLFNRVPGGLVLTEDGNCVLRHVRDMERASVSVLDLLKNRADQVRTVVRISVTEGLGTYWILPKLITFQDQQPALTIELICHMDVASVRDCECDISIQFVEPHDPSLTAHRIARMHVYPFASEVYLLRHGAPSSIAEIVQHRIIQQFSPQLDESAYARKLGVDSVESIVAIRANASSALLYAVEHGAGIGWLPTYAVALEANVVPVDIGVQHHLDIWLVHRRGFEDSERNQIVIDWLHEIFDATKFPCFGDEFIHPNELVPLMKQAGAAMSVRGFSAAEPVPRV